MANGTGIWGEREVIAALMQLADVPVMELDKSAVDAMQPMLDETREHYRALRRRKGQTTFPSDRKGTPSGKHLDQLITVKKTKGNRTKRQYWLSARGRAIKIAHLVEFGTAPHMQPKMKILHPGARPKPGMAPAFEAHSDDVVERLGESLWERLRDRALATGRNAPRRR